jgi:glycosyltransferase involved in cell wall biosynthesis
MIGAPTVTIVVATYNGEAFLMDQLESLAQQTCLPEMVLICDDGSSDRTIEIARAFASRAPFAVEVTINETRLGYADNFLKGASRAETDLIAFCDQDDVWLPKKIKRSIEPFRDPDVLLFYHSSLVVNSELQPAGGLWPHCRNDRVYKPLELNLYLGAVGFSMVFSKKLIRQLDWSNRPIGFSWRPGVPIPHDHWAMLFASILGKVETTKEILALYRRHERNITYLKSFHPIRSAIKRISSRKAIIPAEDIQWMRDSARNDFHSLSELIIFLDRIKDSYSDNWKDRIGMASGMYRQFLPRFMQRASLYDLSIPRTKRMLTWMSLFITGAYREELPGCFRSRFLLKDAACICTE